MGLPPLPAERSVPPLNEQAPPRRDCAARPLPRKPSLRSTRPAFEGDSTIDAEALFPYKTRFASRPRFSF